jgi:hypothetical protein
MSSKKASMRLLVLVPARAGSRGLPGGYGRVAVERIPVDDEMDRRYELVLYRQTPAFPEGHSEGFCTTGDRVRGIEFYSTIAGNA